MENIDEIVVHVRENGEDTTTDEEETSEVAVDVQEVGEPERSADEEWIIESIKQKLQEPSENKLFTILKVDSLLRDGNEDVYTPQLVSIGPYHYGNVQFKDMQDVKYEYFNDLIQRSSKDPDPVPQYVEAVSKKAAEAKKRYLGTDNLTNEKFVEMMVVDGCFLIEFLLKSKKDQIDIVKRKMSQLMNDLLLVENQIPFFILQDLLEVYKRLESKEDNDNSSISIIEDGGVVVGRKPNPITIEVLALSCFTENIRAAQFFFERRLDAQLAAKLFEEKKMSFNHLLHLYHFSLNPYLLLQQTWEPEGVWKRIFTILYLSWEKYGLLCLIIPCIIPPVLIIWLVKTAWSLIIYFMGFILSKLWEWIIMLLLLPSIFCLRLMDYVSFATVVADVQWTSGIPNARYLRNTGFNFKKKETSYFIDVSCSGRTIKIPRLCIQKTTIVQFKNLIALEYSCPNVYGREFTAYAKFLDCLLDAKEDVAILRECDIIDNQLGEDAEVATFFNDLLKGIDVNDDDIPMFRFIMNYYTDGIGHYKVRFFEWRLKLVPEYFSNPWAVPSMIAAFILLVLTVLQTFFTFYPYYKPR